MEQGDNAIVSKVLMGDTEAFGMLVERYQKVIFNLAYRMNRDYDEAEEVVQVAFVKAYEHLDRFNPRFKFFSWLYRITVNESLNRIKSAKRNEELNPGLRSGVRGPDDVLVESETGEKIQDALMDLEPAYRTLIILRHFRDCSYRDMGEILDISEKKVKSRLFTARRLLRDALVSRGILRDA
jgi:RNA polymerase sigma-70 factor (ECF subfamily)